MKIYLIVRYEWNGCHDDWYGDGAWRKRNLFATTDEAKAKKFVEEHKKPTLKSEEFSKWKTKYYFDIQVLDDIQEGNPWEDVEEEDAKTFAKEEQDRIENEQTDKNALQVLTKVKELLDPFHLEAMNSTKEIPCEEIYKTLLGAGIKAHISDELNDYSVYENENGIMVGNVTPRKHGERFDYSPIIINVPASFSFHFSYSVGERWDVDKDIENINRSLSEYIRPCHFEYIR